MKYSNIYKAFILAYLLIFISGCKDDPKRHQYGQVNEACEILNQNDKCVCYSEHILLVERKKV